jgi:Ca-activated chloride channel homolog
MRTLLVLLVLSSVVVAKPKREPLTVVICINELKELVGVRLPTAAPKKRAPGAVVLVIDRSGSMQGAKLDAAKQAITATVAALVPDDIVSVVAFDSESQVYVRPQRAANRTRIGAEVSRLVSGGGTNMWPGIKDAFEILRDVKVNARHVILLSDGETPSDGIAELVADMRKSKITVSTVAVPGADEKLLEQIARDGGGQMYKVDDLKNMSSTFVKDMQQALTK